MSECVLKTLACRGLRVGPSKVLRQIAPESSPESSTKSLSHKYFGIPFLSLDYDTDRSVIHEAVPLIFSKTLLGQWQMPA